MTMPQTFVGVDVSKHWIDAHHLSTGRGERVAAAPAALRAFAASLGGDAFVVCEASGGYERPLTDALAAAGVAHARVNPRQAREFARASGRLAKTDRVDAAMLAEMGRALRLRPEPPPDPARRRLAALVARRDDLQAAITREKQRLPRTEDGFLRRAIAALLRVLARHRAALEAEIAAQIAADRSLAERTALLRTAPGVGPATAAVLVARLPELGRLDRRAIAALAGLAPQARDSGGRRGRRCIWGGRREVRRALYLAAFVASRHDPELRAVRDRLRAAGKPFKLAIVALARKLLTRLNAMLRDQTAWRRSPDAPPWLHTG
jgi:transposase